MAVDRDDIIRQFAELWWAERQNTVFRNRYLGIPTWQHPFDAWATQEIICEVRPDLIVECGSNLGGSALMWSTLLDQVNPNGRVLTIDIERRVTNARLFPAFERVEALVGSTTDAAVVAKVRSRAAGKRTLVILDSDHARDHVRAELDAYWSVVTPGSYLIVQDGVVNGHPVDPDHGPGPFEAVAEFLEANPGKFAVDTDRERMLFTFNPGGFLRRIAE